MSIGEIKRGGLTVSKEVEFTVCQHLYTRERRNCEARAARSTGPQTAVADACATRGARAITCRGTMKTSWTLRGRLDDLQVWGMDDGCANPSA